MFITDVLLVENKSPLKYRLLADFALLVVTAIWGSTFIMVDKAVETLNVLVFIALRFSLAFVVLLLIFGYFVFKRGIRWADIWKGAIIGVFLFIGYAFQTFGLDLGTEPGKAAFITGISVVLVPLFSALILRKKPHLFSWLGILVAFVGLTLVSLTSFNVFQLSDVVSDLLVLVCAFGFAFHIIFIDKYVQQTHFTTLAVIQTGTTAILSWITALAFIPLPQIFTVPILPFIFNNQVLFAVLFTGIIATALILAVQTFAQKRTSPAHVAVIFAMEPVFGALFALIFTEEILLPRQWVGCGLILVSMIFQQLADIYLVQPKELLEQKSAMEEADTAEPDTEQPAEQETDNFTDAEES